MDEQADTEAAERFEALFRTHYAKLLAYTLRRASPNAAQDVVAETWLVAWRRLDDAPSDVLPWLYGIARNVLLNVRRADRRRRSLIERLEQEPPSDEETEPGDGTVAAALNRLRSDDRELLMLIGWDGLSPQSAARSLGCSPARLYVRLHRARRRLMKELDSSGHPSGRADAPKHAEEEPT